MYKRFLKPLLDMIISLIALPFVLLIIGIFGVVIFLTDRGPVFYNANRIGKNGKKYKMYKLRSMSVNSPDIRNVDGSTFNSNDDPRVTPIGRIMRKTSIDEFPQFFNVLKGDMSIVGPRPTVPVPGVSVLEMDDVKKKHYSVRPGITGYSQAYFRNSISQDEKFKQDAYYADNVSFTLDVKILLKTICSVLKRENIYVTKNTTK